MDRLVSLNDLTKAQKKIIEAKDKVINMPIGSGKTSAIVAGCFAFCRGNENINVAIVSKRPDNFNKFIDKMSELDTIELTNLSTGIIIKFVDTNSTMVISKYCSDKIIDTEGNYKLYSENFFTYNVIYFDGLEPCDIVVGENYSYSIAHHEEVLKYLDNCVKDRFAFVY